MKNNDDCASATSTDGTTNDLDVSGISGAQLD